MYNTDIILEKTEKLLSAYKNGLLGGEKMPEHENPNLAISSKENYMYFTLPMSLNYQRNSYTLWECANKMYRDYPDVFSSQNVCAMDADTLKNILVKYKVALQPNKQPIIWYTLCRTIQQDFDGNIKNLFEKTDFRVAEIKAYISENKKKFPYLGGNKICNYWLYVIEQYTDAEFVDRENITVAPDTHVIQASVKLGVISFEEAEKNNVRDIVAERWQKILCSTGIAPIDIHTPLWLWSRNKFDFIV